MFMIPYAISFGSFCNFFRCVRKIANWIDFHEVSCLRIFLNLPRKFKFDENLKRVTGKFHCLTVHFNSLNFIHQLMHFYMQ